MGLADSEVSYVTDSTLDYIQDVKNRYSTEINNVKEFNKTKAGS